MVYSLALRAEGWGSGSPSHTRLVLEEIFGCIQSSVLRRSHNVSSPLGRRHIAYSCSTKGLRHGVVVRLGLALGPSVPFSTARITNTADVLLAFPKVSWPVCCFFRSLAVISPHLYPLPLHPPSPLPSCAALISYRWSLPVACPCIVTWPPWPLLPVIVCLSQKHINS